MDGGAGRPVPLPQPCCRIDRGLPFQDARHVRLPVLRLRPYREERPSEQTARVQGLRKDLRGCGTILFQTTKNLAVWNQYIDCMMRKLPLCKMVKICRMRLSTAFVWRHKILDALTNMMDEIKLDGVVECDETYELLSNKGNHRNSKTFTMPRKPRKRGGKASRRDFQANKCASPAA